MPLISKTGVAALALAVGAVSCKGADRSKDGAGAPQAATAGTLTGAGATFPNPIYAKWFATYAQQTGVKINYQSIGSGGGIRQYTEGTVDFGASDGPMTDEQIAAVHGDVLHVPTVLGAVVLTYNLPGTTSALRFDGPLVADIFLGKVSKWNDPRIAVLNPGAKLPKSDIIVVHRSDGSGTSYIFTDYLSKVSPEWSSKVGTATSVNWPVGLGGKGNEGVTQQVKQSVGSIGYVELIYAASNHLPSARMRNAAGAFVEASLQSVTAAAGSAHLAPDTDFRVSITNAAGADAYPISSFTWLLVHRTPGDTLKRRELNDFLGWMIGPEAQQAAAALQYAPLPPSIVALVRERIGSM